MRYAIIPHILSVIFMIFTWRFLYALFPDIYEYRTYLIPMIALIWFMILYKGIQWNGQKLDQVDDQLVARREARAKRKR